MIPAAFEYHAAKTVEEALRLLERHGDEAKLLAGGHSLLPMMKLRLAAPRFVVDIGRVKGLQYIREEGGHVAIGALVTHSDVAASDLLRARCPLLPETAEHIGDAQVRNRGTLGGNLAHADPAADYPAAVLALDAELVVTSSAGKRTIPAAEFFVDLLSTQMRAGEILTEVRVPVQGARCGSAYAKLAQQASGFALCGVAACVRLNGKGAAEHVRVGVTGVGVKAYRATAVEQALQGRIPESQAIQEAARHAADNVDVLADLHASADYRRAMALVYARRALTAAAARAAGKRA
jgi:carbon-monoxide dehydrogenase medium subunit